jgi:hypothetical protein
MARLIEPVDLGTAEQLLGELLPNTSRLWKRFREGGKRPSWIFRGQANAEWGLQAKSLRSAPPPFREFQTVDPALLAKQRGRDEIQKLEMSHVLAFVGLADDLGHSIPGDGPHLRDPRPRMGTSSVFFPMPDVFPPTQLLDMFALAQHYGVPTRLLDWTTKPLVAAYFAAAAVPVPAPPNAPRIAVWALEREVINRGIGCNTWPEPRRAPIVAFLNAPAATNPNLAAQGGLFTLIQVPIDDKEVPALDTLVDESGDHIPEDGRPAIYKFTVPASEARQLLRLLDEHQVHPGSVFPGLAGVVDALKARARIE